MPSKVPNRPVRNDKNPMRNKEEKTAYLFLKTKKEAINIINNSDNKNKSIRLKKFIFQIYINF